MIVSRDYLRTSENNTELHIGIRYSILFLNRGYSGLQGGVVSGDYSGLHRVIHNYTEGYIITYSP